MHPHDPASPSSDAPEERAVGRETPVQPFRVARLSDVVPVSVLQTLETGLATRHGIPLTIVEPDGEGLRHIRPFEEGLNRARFCRLYAGTCEGRARCWHSDFEITRQVVAQGGQARPQWLQCHMGLAEVAIPIVVDDKVVAVLFTGHRRLPGTEEQMKALARHAAAEIPELDAEALCAAIDELPVVHEDEMARLAAELESHAEAIAGLGRDRYDLERRLRQELLLNELMVGLARPCQSNRELETRLQATLARVTDFFRLSYAIVYSQPFPRAPEIAPIACAGECGGYHTTLLGNSPRPELADGEPTYQIYTTPEEVHGFLSLNASPVAMNYGDAQAIIFDFGDPGERMTVTIFGPPREGHTETLLNTAGDDFLERFQFEVGMRAKVARLLLDLRQANEDQTQFLAQTTHEINAGLQTIVEEVEWLQFYMQELAPSKDDEVAEPLQKILSEVMRLGARSRSSLFHLRGGMPRTEYKLKDAHPLDRLIAACVEPYRGIAMARNITIKIDDSVRELPRARFDWEMLKIVFMNLIDNAVKYSHFNRTVRIWGKADAERACVAIEDFGLGIPEDENERIFEPYVRGSQRDPRRFIWGSGLGLAVARDIIETHGGTIEVKSTPTARAPVSDPAHRWENFITTFTVCLPLRQEEQP